MVTRKENCDDDDIDIASNTFRVNTIIDGRNTMLEQLMTVCINAKPKFWPNWFYKWAIRKLVKIKIYNKPL